ncbi:MAG: polysaccharide biosynthesis protein [Chitinophagaceae bacterium]
MKEFRNFLLRKHIAPKWVIFLLDLLICIFSIVYANYLLYDFHFVSVGFNKLWDDILVTIILNAFYFSILKTYAGIIRFSGFHEAIRTISAVFCSFLSMLMLNVFLVIFKITPFIATSALFIYFFIAAFLIFGYRVLVKTLYNASINEDNLTHVVIFGAGLNASLLMKTIEQISNGKYKVVSFLEDDEKLIGKSIDNIKIYSYKNLWEVIRNFNLKILFFARQNFDIAVKNKVVDECLEMQIKVMNIPPMRSWMQGHLNISQLQEVKIDELLNRPTIQLQNGNLMNLLRNKTILITGAAGSIGSELARQISAMRPYSLIVCDQIETGLYDLEYELQQKFNLGNCLQIYLGDVKDEKSMDQLFNIYKPNIVFHAAAYKHVPLMENHPSEAIRNNVLGTKVLSDLSEIYEVDRFLLISTDKAINPTNIMGASKRIAEIYCHSLHNRVYSSNKNEPFIYQINSKKRTKFITTRFGNVLGSNGSVIPRFQQQISNGGPVTVTHPDVIRYFMTIPEACSLVLEAATMGNGGEVFLFDMGEPVNILDLAKKMIKLAGMEPGKDIEIQFIGLRPGEKLFEELLNKQEEVIPTHHKKILIAKVINYDYDKISESINRLLLLAQINNDEEVVKQMKYIVPEYISNNPIYEMISNQMLSQAISSRV